MATSAGQVQSTISVVAKTNGVDKTATQIAKLQLATEKLRTQQAKTATQIARAVSIQNKDAASKAKTALQTQKLALQNEKLATSISKAKNQQSLLNKALDLSKFVALGYTLKNVANGFINLIGNAADYTENLNLFQVVMGKSIDKANDFVNSMHDVLGLDTSKLMEYMGTFKGMANNMGILEDKAYEMSEGLTKLTYDLASFYNTSVDQAFQSLSSAITGQTKSIREQFKGIDVTQGTLQIDLDRLGIDKQVSDLSYAEKSILRYISILRQSSSAQGDFARTMVSPAQMMKQLTERVVTLARAFGSIFIPILQATLPYILALTSLLTKLFNTIAKFLGYETMEFDYSGLTTGLGAASDDLDSVGGSADSANKKVKEFKKQLQGFDVLNVITTPTDTSSKGAGGGGGAGGIDQGLLDAIKNYDNRLDLASDKVKKLEEAIQSFLSKLDFEPLKKSLDNLYQSMKLVGNFAWQGLKDFYKDFLVPIARWTIGEGLPKFVNIIADGLAKINWDNLNQKLSALWQALAPFAIHVGEGLLWFFEEALVPLGVWTISDALPVFLDMLTNAIKILDNAIQTAMPVIKWLWENFLQPIAKFTGGAVIGFLKGIAGALESISRNKAASTLLAGLALTILPSLLKLGLTSKTKTLTTAEEKLSAVTKILGGNVTTTSQKTSGFSKVISGLKTIFLTSTQSLYNLTSGVGSFAKGILTGEKNVKTLTSTLKNKITTVKESTKSWAGNLKGVDKFRIGLVGATGLVVSLKATSAAMQDIVKEGKPTIASVGELTTGIAGAATSGAALGTSILPGVGTAIGAIAGTLINATSALIDYNKACKEQEAYDKMFDGQGVSLDRIIDKFGGLTDSYNIQIENIQEYNNKMEENKQKIDDTYSSLDTLYAKMDSDTYSVTTDDIKMMEQAYKDINDTTKILTQTETDNYINYVTNLKNSKLITKENASERISTALTVQAVENEISTEYYEAQKNLLQQYKDGKISASEYTEKLQELKSIYEVTATSSDKTKVSVKNLVEEISAKGIDFKNYEATKQFVKEVGQTYDDNKKKVNTYYDEQEKRLTNEQIQLEARMRQVETLYGKESEQYKAFATKYKDVSDSLKLNDETRQTELEELKGTYKGLYEGVLAEMESSGLASTKKGKEIADDINSSLEKIGDVDMSDFGTEMYNAIISWNAKVVPNAKKIMGEVGDELSTEFETNVTDLDENGLKKYYGDAGTTSKESFKNNALLKPKDKNDLLRDYGIAGQNNGKSMDEGTAKGINDNNKLIQNSIKSTTDSNKAFLKGKNGWDINSPSHVTQEYGKSIDEGLAKGITDNTKMVQDAIKKQMSTLKKEFDNTKFKINISSNVESSFNSILSKLQTFCNNFRNAINNLVSGMSSTMNGVRINTEGKVSYTRMPYIGVQKFADGGIPDVGSLFVAGEAGPEWVGDVGGKTGVLNNDQLSNTVASALDKVMAKYMGRQQQQSITTPIQVYVGGDKVEETTRKINIRNENVYGTGR